MNEMRFDMDDRSERGNGDGPARLSPAGQARRTAMRALLEREVSRQRTRRTYARRGLAAAALSLGILVLAERLEPWKQAPVVVIETPPMETLPPPEPVAPPLEGRLQSIRFEVVRAKPDLEERWRVRGKPSDVKVLSDDDLLRELAAADMPSGLIRVPEGYILTADLTRPARRG
jgi:hypothetical protein